MADDKRNIEIKFNTNAEETKGKVDKLNKSVEDTAKVTNDATKSTDKLTESVTSNGGAMSILDSITGGYATRVKDAMEASNLFKKSTDGMTLSQRAYTAVVGTSTGALKTFRIALAATGIGAVVVLLGLLIANWDKLTGALSRAEKAQKAVNDAMAQGTANAKAESAELLRLVAIARDETASKEARLAAIEAINEISPEYLGNISLETINTDNATTAINNYVEALSRKMQAQAIEKAIQKTYDDELEFRTKQASDYLKWYDYILNGWYDIDEAARDRQLDDIKDSLSQRRALENQLQELLVKNPELISDATKNANKAILDNTKSTNRQIVESEEAKTRRLTEEARRRAELLKRINLDYRDYLDREGGISPTRGMIARAEENFRLLQEQRAADIKSIEETTEKGSNAYESLMKTVEDYYSVQFDNLRKQREEFNTIDEVAAKVIEYRDLVFEDGSEFVDVEHYKTLNDLTVRFINNISNPQLKEYYANLFNVEQILATRDAMRKFRDTTEGLVDYTLDSDVNVLNSLFGTDSDAAASAETRLKENLDSIQQMQLDSIRSITNITNVERLEIEKYYNKMSEEERQRYAQAMVDIDKLQFRQRMTALTAFADMTGATAQLMSEHTAGHKTLAIASATIDTYTSAVSSYKGMVEAIPGPVGIAAGVAAAAASVAMGLNNVKQILAVKVPGGGGSSGGGGSNSFNQPNVDFVSSSENQIANTVGDRMQSNNEPIKAYVVSGEISSSQALERNKIESNSL